MKKSIDEFLSGRYMIIVEKWCASEKRTKEQYTNILKRFCQIYIHIYMCVSRFLSNISGSSFFHFIVFFFVYIIIQSRAYDWVIVKEDTFFHMFFHRRFLFF